MTFDLSPDAVARLEAEASRRGDLSQRHREIRAEKTSGLTARDF